MGTQNFSFVPRLRQDEKTSFLILYRAQNLPSLLFLPKIVALLRCQYNLAQGFCQMLQAKLRNLTEDVNTVLIKLSQHRLVIDYN